MRIHVVLLAAALAIPTVVALDPLGLQDDARLGADAPDAASGAALLAAGTYEGRFDGAADRADWFHAGILPDQRLRVTYSASSGAFFFRVVNPAGTQVFQGFSQGSEFTYTAAYGSDARFGFVADDPSTGATYRFKVEVVTPRAQEDAGTPGDADGSRAGARVVAEGSFAGLLDPADGDRHDWYAFTQPADSWLMVTLTLVSGPSVSIGVYGSSAAPARSATTTGGPVTLELAGVGQALDVTTSGSAPVEYVVFLDFLPQGPPDGQDDANLGIDAPTDMATAPVLAAGTYPGSLQFWAGDKNDYYRVDVPEGLVLRVALTVLEGSFYAGIYDETTRHAQTHVPGDATTITGGQGTVWIAIGDNAQSVGQARYLFTISYVDPHDAAVLDVVVTPVPGSPHLRNVHVVVANLGGEAFGETVLDIEVISREAAPLGDTSIGGGWVSLGPGQVAEFDATWDMLTFVGEFDVGAGWVRAGDMQPENDKKYVRQSALVDPGTGDGVAPLPWQPIETFVLPE